MKCRLEQFRVEIMVYVHSNLILLILIYRMWDQWLKGKTKMVFFCSIIVGGAHTGMNEYRNECQSCEPHRTRKWLGSENLETTFYYFSLTHTLKKISRETMTV
jgi:hypothetical protein